ncbi:MAG: hypothetical protein H6739_39615 [Alphaproteobacteria bacterium]|nr:hypothetical protein [Alphaproteobacteria bacterium]
MLPLLALVLACTPASEPDPDPDPVVDTAPADDGYLPWMGSAYVPCVSDAECDAGAACTTVPGFGGLYCAPPCDPLEPADPACDLDGALPFETQCMTNGRCARACGEPDSCPEALDCMPEPPEDGLSLCAGEPYGSAGFYGTCSHPNVDGTDCPEASSCFGGDYLGIDEGACLPWCDDGSCPPPPAGTSGVTTICYDVGLDHPSCALLCVPDDSTCPIGQTCFDLGFTGLCAPEGASYG